MQKTILVVDDEEFVYRPLRKRLENEGYRVLIATDGEIGLDLARAVVPDLIVLDIIMPDMDGYEMCKLLRADAKLSHMPILMLTANPKEEHLARGFEAGADDFLTKPYEFQELQLRIQALLRRASISAQGDSETKSNSNEIQVGDLILNERTFEAKTENGIILLTNTQYLLLHFLMKNAGHIFTTHQLLQNVWNYPTGTGSPELVRTHIRNLREKIESDAKHPKYIRTVQGHGYTFASDNAEG